MNRMLGKDLKKSILDNYLENYNYLILKALNKTRQTCVFKEYLLQILYELILVFSYLSYNSDFHSYSPFYKLRVSTYLGLLKISQSPVLILKHRIKSESCVLNTNKNVQKPKKLLSKFRQN